MADLENIRHDDDFRKLVEEQTAILRRGGFSDREIGLWLAGARWAVRIMQPQEQREVA